MSSNFRDHLYLKETPDDHHGARAIVFGLFEDNTLLYVRDWETTHGDLIIIIKSLISVANGKHAYRTPSDLRSVMHEDGIQFFPDITQNLETFVNWLNGPFIASVIKKDDQGYDDEFTRSDTFKISGRMTDWSDPDENETISFWQKKALILQYLDKIKAFLAHINVAPEKCIWEPIDGPHESYQDFTEDLTKPTRSEDEIRELMKKQHLDPTAKAALGKAGAGSIKKGTVAKLAGYQSPAAYSFAKGESFSDFFDGNTF